MTVEVVKNTITCTLDEAGDLGVDVLKGKRVPFFLSSPGLGKSAMLANIAERFNLKFIDVRMSSKEPQDTSGMADIMNRGTDQAYSTYVPFEFFPTEDTPVPEGYKGWLLCLDELNSAPRSVLAPCYEILWDHSAGGKPLHRKCAVAAAGNLMTDKAIVNNMGSAIDSRVVWFQIRSDYTVWDKWAAKSNIDSRVRGFLGFKPNMLHKFDPNHNEKTFPCPRTWNILSDVIGHIDNEDFTVKKLPLVAGCIGDGAAREFYSFVQVCRSLPTLVDIEMDPVNIALSDEPSVHYALSGLIGTNMTRKNVVPLMTFLNRLNVEFQTLAIRAAVANDHTIIDTPEIETWLRKHAEKL